MTLKEIAIELFKNPNFKKISIQPDHVAFECGQMEYMIIYDNEEEEPFIIKVSKVNNIYGQFHQFESLEECLALLQNPDEETKFNVFCVVAESAAVLEQFKAANPDDELILYPEYKIHPRMMRKVYHDQLDRLYEQKIQHNIYFLTLSPTFLDLFSDHADSVLIFEQKDDGTFTTINLQKDIIEPNKKKARDFGIRPIDYTYDLGSHWTSGFIGGVPQYEI